MTNIERVSRTSADLVAVQRDRLRELFPEVFAEEKVDFDKLRATLGELVDERRERYTFSWAGKSDTIRILQTPSHATLVPAPEESVNFDATQNLFIEGDNLEVLKLLLKPYFGRVKMIYIDPPYNTGNDFVYPDDFRDPLHAYLQLTGQADAEGNLLTSNPEASGRYHSAWLSMMYPRLFLARQLLRDDGVIFVSIDDHEVANLRLLMNEVFGEENFVAQITVLTNPKGRVLREHFAQCHDYLIVYAKNSSQSEFSVPKTEEEIARQYPHNDAKGRYRPLELRNTHRQFGKHNRRRLWYPLYVNPSDGSVSLEGAKGWQEVWPRWHDGYEGCWTWGEKKVKEEGDGLIGLVVSGSWKVFRKAYAVDELGKVARRKFKTIWEGKEFSTETGQSEFDKLIPGGVFQSPKPTALIQRFIAMSTGEDDILLDFFSGSCTTAHAALTFSDKNGNANRQFIMVQLPEPTPSNSRTAGFSTIADIGKERIRRVIQRINADEAKKLDEMKNGADLGFKVFKLTKSNYKNWEPYEGGDAEQLVEQMAMFDTALVAGAKDVDVIYEVLLKEGYDLNSTIMPETNHAKLWRVNDAASEQSFRICLEDKIEKETIDVLGLRKDDLFICLDTALDDTAKANVALQCRLKTI